MTPLRLLVAVALAMPGAATAAHFGCDVADDRVVVTENSTLDSTCTYTRGVLI